MKIFAYGCSFTSYNWPSYADILGLQYDVVNSGSSGSSNERIFYNLMNDVRNNKINKNDIVITQWSGTNRFNYLKTNGVWIGEGNVLLPHNKWIYNKIKGWFNPEFEYQKTINTIIAAQTILEKINCKHVQMSLHPLDEVDKNFLENDLEGTYLGDYTFTEFTWKTLSDAVYVDSHPTVIQHYDIAKRICNNLNLELKINIELLDKVHNEIKNENTFDVKQYTFTNVQ